MSSGQEQATQTGRRRSWVNRLGCLVGIIVWLFFMSLPIFVFQLINNGQLEWGEDPQNQIRLFLLQEPGYEGIGLQWSVTRDEAGSCVETAVYYLMFAGEAENSRSCTCMENLGDRSPPAGCSLP